MQNQVTAQVDEKQPIFVPVHETALAHIRPKDKALSTSRGKR